MSMVLNSQSRLVIDKEGMPVIQSSAVLQERTYRQQQAVQIGALTCGELNTAIFSLNDAARARQEPTYVTLGVHDSEAMAVTISLESVTHN